MKNLKILEQQKKETYSLPENAATDGPSSKATATRTHLEKSN